jgi:hypothetical protein
MRKYSIAVRPRKTEPQNDSDRAANADSEYLFQFAHMILSGEQLSDGSVSRISLHWSREYWLQRKV